MAVAFTGCAALPGEPRWLKASLHVHTKHSDGENEPGDVLRWYAKNGYDVVAITDHNRPATLGALAAAPAGLLVIPGVEFTSKGGGRPVHVNGLFAFTDPNGLDEATPAAALVRMLAFFEQAGALAVINHPNYEEALTLDDLLAANAGFLEVFNASSGAENEGHVTGASTEDLWDALLRRGRRVYGIAVDDMHALPGGTNRNVPGGGFVMIYARPDWIDVRAALVEGRFYASNGPVLDDVRFSGSRVTAVPAGTRGCHWRLHGNEAAMRKAGTLRLNRPTRGYLRAVYDCGDAGRVYLQPLVGN